MKLFLKQLSTAGILVILLQFFTSYHSYSQTHTPRNIKINSKCNGYYEYLPANYNSGSEEYPVIIFLHGLGDAGNGTSELSKLLLVGIPKLINDKRFPSSFTVNSQSFSFIVISPQYMRADQVSQRMDVKDMEDLVNFVTANYRVNRDRIYMTGLSAGGYATWLYASSKVSNAQKLAAIVPIAGDLWPTTDLASVIAQGNLPVRATHNSGDPNVNSFLTSNWVNWINNPGRGLSAPTIRATATIFPDQNTHDAWTRTYDPNNKINGLNIYEWMLQNARIGNAPLPVNISDFTATASGSKILLNWTTTYEQNNASFEIERSRDGVSFTSIATVKATNAPAGSNYSSVDNVPAPGDNFYRLVQKDLDGKTSYLKTVHVSFVNAAPVSLSLMPNPATDFIYLSLNDEEKGRFQITIIGQDGKLIETRTINKFTTYFQERIIVDYLKSGFYIVQITGGEKQLLKTIKFIKQ